jgi:hypothetical protein
LNTLMIALGLLSRSRAGCGRRCGGESSEAVGMTRRQEALEVWRRLRAGVLFNS